MPTPQLYICKPCKRQEFHDVEGKPDARACEQCARPMQAVTPTQAQRHFRRYALDSATV